jgi:nickel/cobalt exporter
MAVLLKRFAALGFWSVFFSLLSASNVSAHPLGNFTINHLAELRPFDGQLRVHYVLDIAEIPTFQIMHASDSWTPARKRDWENEEALRVANGVVVESGGAAFAMRLEHASSRTRPGAGGLPTLYWAGDFTIALPAKSRVTIRDLVYADRRIGWKDITLPGLLDPTNELRAYPSALIGSPRHNDVATFDLLPGGRVEHVRISGDGTVAWGVTSIVRSSALSDLFSRSTQTPLLIFLTILAAFGLGALHGVEPGHGKALLAFTLVGARATFKQAVILAGALTFAHTIAVLLLGVLLFFAAEFATERLFTWITLASGAIVAVIGARSLSAAVRRALHARDREHEHGRSHAIAGSAPLHFPSAVVAAMSGGIAPCPAAIVVLLTALRLHRVGYGLLLIVIFSLGLAAILTGLGLAVVHGAAWLQRRSGFARLTRIAPFLTSSVISIIGATMLAQGLIDQGVRVPGVALIALTLLGITTIASVPFVLSIRTIHRTPAIKEPI